MYELQTLRKIIHEQVSALYHKDYGSDRAGYRVKITDDIYKVFIDILSSKNIPFLLRAESLKSLCFQISIKYLQETIDDPANSIIYNKPLYKAIRSRKSTALNLDILIL